MPAVADLVNSEKVNASFDITDKKGIVISPFPAGATLDVTNSDEGVAQWRPDVAGGNVGMITTETDKIGQAVLTGTATLPDGTTFTDTLTVTVRNSAPSSGAFTVGTPVEE